MFTFTWLGVQYTWTQAQLDAFWARYVVMNGRQASDVFNQEPQFMAQYVFCMQNRMYGFAAYNYPIAGSNVFGSGGIVVSGPTKS